ncbi:MAG TPA: 1-deoxy-D-xylulose-5-phosphate reductoisomerase [Acidiferrobacteraceae bacterium]|nr:1-deoxy-D-xylulose-5-phosphate reductoisomerase [Acidiferrobacteraceae bacterium]
MKGVSILGSTGSIGVSTLDVIARHPGRYRIVALTANRQVDRLLEQCRRYHPKLVVLKDEKSARLLRQRVQAEGLDVMVQTGQQGLEKAATHPEAQIVMAAIVGAAGLLPTLAAVKSAKQVLLANKEPLVMAGDIIMQNARQAGAALLPIDSEHNAIYQCLPDRFEVAGEVSASQGLAAMGVRRILLTGSGGPFRSSDPQTLANVTPAQACKHPNWSMGPKISVDSATMMNKGLELIEACRLFACGPDEIDIVVHPQSVIHSMVEYVDGSVLAQLGNPDMRTPIAHALAWPGRMTSGVSPLDIFKVARLDFEPPDSKRFPCLLLARQSALVGGTSPTILNAANEEAVTAFLDGVLAFGRIPAIIEQTLGSMESVAADSLDIVLQADQEARACARGIIGVLETKPNKVI